ncbi:ATP-binding protein [Phytohabitans houttuyneae]|uniref:ATPase n=1 Tax=Phytohabitans houttuyneae TaxID=1076126 RepID=A0A6V8KGS7_9ACTN|nr:ATP-binding protein [Phytohabitans houttuyneae]GFJ84443.1 ATPase [Phytohabitans houttuyneae]
MPTRADLALAHLRLRLAGPHRALRAAATRQAELAARLLRPDLTPYCVTDEQAALLLERLDAWSAPGPSSTGETGPPGDGDEQERELRREAEGAGIVLPLDALAARCGLDRTEQDILLLVAGPELDPAYERVYAYIVDNLHRRLPSVELVAATLGGPGARRRLAVRRMLGPAGRLRRYGLVDVLPGTGVELARELVPAPGVTDLLLGEPDAGLVGHDPGEVATPPGYAPPAVDPARTARLGRALATGQVDLLGLWGATPSARRDAAVAVAAHSGRPLRTVLPGADPAEAVRLAAALGAVLWLPTGEPAESPSTVDLLVRARLPVILSGDSPWRPVPLLAARAYAEWDLPAPGFRERHESWSTALPGLSGPLLDELAARYRLGGDELRAVAAVAGAGARFAGNGRPAPIADHVRPAVAAVTRGRTSGYLRAVTPRRTLDDLVLPPEQLRHITEIAAAFRAWPRVAEAWGFGRHPGDAGVKVLFSGEPGTGKTLCAEILAGTLGVDLLTVDLSQVVSKWVGETEKNLDAAFRQAEESRAVLFFDEADSLFGKRGDVRHGTDRYANLEIGYLLQRLESSDVLVILASNLRENIDAAFTRRFTFVVHFTRPGPAERRRLWRLAFPPAAPLASDVDLAALSRLDMTGAAIAAAARSAALIAAESGGGTIPMRAVVAGVARQYQREARLLRPAELGAHAALLAPVEPSG